MIPGLLLTAAIVAAWCYAPRLCDRLADAAERESRPFVPGAVAHLRAVRLADVTDATEPAVWDDLAADDRWRTTLRQATRRREKAA